MKKIIILILSAVLLFGFTLTSCSFGGSSIHFIEVFDKVLESVDIKKGGNTKSGDKLDASSDTFNVYADELNRLEVALDTLNGSSIEFNEKSITLSDFKRESASIVNTIFNYGSFVKATMEVINNFSLNTNYCFDIDLPTIFKTVEIDSNTYKTYIKVLDEDGEIEAVLYLTISNKDDNAYLEYVSAGSTSLDIGFYDEKIGNINILGNLEGLSTNPLNDGGEITVSSISMYSVSSLKNKTNYTSSKENGEIVRKMLSGMNFDKELDVSLGLEKSVTIDLDTCIEIDQKFRSYNYQSPYGELPTSNPSKLEVLNEYTVPSDVIIIKTNSIPACKKLIITKQVEKIEENPFKYPKYLEDIVFTNPDDGNLTEIGFMEDGKNRDSSRFFLSFTNVKSFVLPKTVKRLAINQFFLCCHMQLLDLSNLTLVDNTPYPHLSEENEGRFWATLTRIFTDKYMRQIMEGGSWDKNVNIRELAQTEARKITDTLMGKTKEEIEQFFAENDYGLREYEIEDLLGITESVEHLVGMEDRSFIMQINSTAIYRFANEQVIDKFLSPKGVFGLVSYMDTENLASSEIKERLGVDKKHPLKVDESSEGYLIENLILNCDEFKNYTLVSVEISQSGEKNVYWLFKNIKTANQDIRNSLEENMEKMEKSYDNIKGSTKILER